jgi:hypothetical protein
MPLICRGSGGCDLGGLGETGRDLKPRGREGAGEYGSRVGERNVSHGQGGSCCERTGTQVVYCAHAVHTAINQGSFCVHALGSTVHVCVRAVKTPAARGRNESNFPAVWPPLTPPPSPSPSPPSPLPVFHLHVRRRTTSARLRRCKEYRFLITRSLSVSLPTLSFSSPAALAFCPP